MQPNPIKWMQVFSGKIVAVGLGRGKRVTCTWVGVAVKVGVVVAVGVKGCSVGTGEIEFAITLFQLTKQKTKTIKNFFIGFLLTIQ